VLWASCGGGGGSLGIITSLDLQISLLPNQGQVTYVEFTYAPGVEGTVEGLMKVQEWLVKAPQEDDRYGVDGISLGDAVKGPQLAVSVRGWMGG